MMDFRTPLGRVRGQGSAKDGAGHWWAQRLTAIALVPLVLWFTISVVGLIGSDYNTMVEWVSNPWVSVFLILFLCSTFYHAQLGLQVVLEDYIHHEGGRLASIIFIKFLCIVLATAGVVSVLRIGLGA